MKWFGKTPPPSVSRPFGLVIDRALEQGVPKPTGLVFIDSDGVWRDAMAGLSLAERRTCIAVALHDEGLVAATHWSIGGGVLLPPSLLRVSAACRAARESLVLPSWTADPQAVSEFGIDKHHLTVGLQPAGLWQAMVGVRGQLELLAALAVALKRPAVIGPGPSLTLIGFDRIAIETAWQTLAIRPQWAAGNRFLKIGDSDRGVDEDIEGRWWPVALLPSGRVVARWKLDVANTMCPWRLETDGGRVLQTDSVCTQPELERSTADVVRIHGMPASDLERDGSPGAIVVEVLAREADRSGQTLWVPGVSRAAGAVIRRWGLDVWVDGPVLAPFSAGP
ncbi:MAG: hypothetical protein DRJ65_21210 [Acidobacteria bacterium]|nr:MAG: hypothetical protein DRJ65_21210 [Acidobacteriota bacterium]